MSNEPTTEVELAVSSVATKAWNRVQNFVPDLKKQFVDNAISLLKEQGHSMAESEEVRQEAMRHSSQRQKKQSPSQGQCVP